MPTIQVKRGLVANLPASAAAGEPVYTTDDQQLHFGTGAAVVPLKISAVNVTGLVNGGTETVNAQAGTSYTVVSGDAGKLVTLSNASAVAVTVPAGVFTSGQYADFQNKGAGDVTITTTSATINGAATFVLHTNQGIRVVFDGTNFQVVLGRAVVAKSSTTSQWLNSVAADGTFTSSQPAFTDVSGTLAAGQLPATIDGGTF
jgi:Major tropism determinant N-terminal domain